MTIQKNSHSAIFSFMTNELIENLNKEDIGKLLHHRDPYLMVDHVIQVSPQFIHASKTHHMGEGHIKGHFPEGPIVPGAMLQELCTQSSGVLITLYYSPVENYDSEMVKGHALGVLRKVHFAKYTGVVTPDRTIEVETSLDQHLGDLFRFNSTVRQGGKICAKLKYDLVNIPSSALYQQ
jgi:3-hydroxyacyl-[acyl-carrier-protein] dehydratase